MTHHLNRRPKKKRGTPLTADERLQRYGWTIHSHPPLTSRQRRRIWHKNGVRV